MMKANQRPSGAMQNQIVDPAANRSYETPLKDRYASNEMLHLFSQQYKHSTWRRLWVALAEAEKELGLDISVEQVTELKAHIDDIDFNAAADYEAQFNHDVVAHIHTYGDCCPTARPIIHLGATSCYVTDNTDTIQMQEAVRIILGKLKQVVQQLADFAQKHAGLPCLGFTHFQPAQLTTVGKRACLWIQDFHMDLEEVEYRRSSLKFLGVKGATGTQASFLSLFKNDHDKVRELDKTVAKLMGFSELFLISGQTYTRKQDAQVLQSLANFAASAHKFATDLRLLAGMKEMEEPFPEKQVGSSAMPYKRNPILSERICALSRFVIALGQNPQYTHATQWLERSLDDSANRRLSLSEAFLTTDAILNLLIRVTKGLVIYPKIIQKHIDEELPFIATENILMEGVMNGGDRQVLHEKIRQHSQAAGKIVKENGEPNDLLRRIQEDPDFDLSSDDLTRLLSVDNFVGRAPEQVHEFLKTLTSTKGK